MFDIIFQPDQPFWKQLKFTILHGAAVGFGLGVGVTMACLVAAHFGWIPGPGGK